MSKKGLTGAKPASLATNRSYSIPFNILSAHSELEKRLIASDLTAVFQRLSTSWGDQMTSVLNNAVLAFLESSQGGTLVEMRRFLIEPAFRNQFLRSVNEPNVVYYWQKVFPQLVGNKSVGPLVTRLDLLLAKKPISHMVAQQENRLDFSAMMNEGKIFLAKLSQGEIGFENSCLMGSLLMPKLHLAAMSRQSIPEANRRHFFIYLDEAHNFATPSMVEILTGARKYRVGLVLAHQELGQLERMKEIAGAILGCHTRVAFHVTDNDARKLSEGFAHFEAADLMNLEKGEAICKVERADYDFNLSVPFSEPVDPVQAQAVREAVIQASRRKYGTLRSQVAEALRRSLPQEEPAKPSKPTQSVPPPSPPSLPKDAELKPSEVQKPTVSEMEKPAAEPVEVNAAPPAIVPVAAVQTTRAPGKPAPATEENGIGGYQHNLIQQRIKAVARELGFHADREVRTDTGQKIDLALVRQGQLIGCEISITTSVDWDVGSVAKCLKAGCQHVAVISPSENQLKKLRKAVAGCMAAEEAAKVGYYLLEQFIEFLKTLKAPEGQPAEPQPAVLGKYKVKARAAITDKDEIAKRQAMAHKAMAQALRRKP